MTEILPSNRRTVPWEDHDQGDDCWCAPELYQACPQCVVEMADEEVGTAKSRAELMGRLFPNPADNCWRCGGLGYVDAFDGDLARVIVHRVMLAGVA